MSEFTEKLEKVYRKKNTARLVRKATNIENALYREIASRTKRDEKDRTRWPSQNGRLGEYREMSYSQRLRVLLTILSDRGLQPDIMGIYRNVNHKRTYYNDEGNIIDG